MSLSLDEIVRKIEAEGFQWAVCMESNGRFTAYVDEGRSLYIAENLMEGSLCVEGATAVAALKTAFDQELEYKRLRNEVSSLDHKFGYRRRAEDRGE